MGRFSHLKVLYRLLLAPSRGRTHDERMENFYRQQAQMYDETREGMLHGRKELYSQIAAPDGGVWIELGAGTGSNLELIQSGIISLGQVHLVDLSPSLLRIAQERIDRHGWTNVVIHQQDATTFTSPTPADVVVFSYSLTMIPDWFAAVDNARLMLKPGGLIAVVDYYVSRNHPPEGWVRHSWATRTYGPTLFDRNNVQPSPDHLPYLHYRFEPVLLEERTARLLGPLFSTPYYLFIGRKPVEATRLLDK